MNCSQCQEQFAAYLETTLEPDEQSRFDSHLSACPACRAEFEQVQRLVGQLVDRATAVSFESMDTDVMVRILREQARQIRRLQMRRRFRLLAIGGPAAAAAVFFVLTVFWPTQPNNTAQAAQFLAKAAEEASDLRSVHIRGRFRTRPQESFAVVRPECDFVPVEVWRQFGEDPKWRVEKPEAIAVMDGTLPVLLLRSKIAAKGKAEATFDTDWLLRLADVGDIITKELRAALAQGSDLKLAHRKGPDGKRRLVVTIDAAARKDVADHVKKAVLTMSDHRRVYQFDAETRRLEDVKIYMRPGDREVLVFEATEIKYDAEIEPTTFALEIPDNVSWYREPQKLPDNEKYEKMPPDEVTRALLEAFAKGDWEEAQKHWAAPITERMKERLAGLQIIRIGEPFRSGVGSVWSVPYEIKLVSGQVRKFNLNLRKFESAGRYVAVGGGL